MGNLCASAQKSFSQASGRTCSPPLVSPLTFFYMGWKVLPNATTLLRVLIPTLHHPDEWPRLVVECTLANRREPPQRAIALL